MLLLNTTTQLQCTCSSAMLHFFTTSAATTASSGSGKNLSGSHPLAYFPLLSTVGNRLKHETRASHN